MIKHSTIILTFVVIIFQFLVIPKTRKSNSKYNLPNYNSLILIIKVVKKNIMFYILTNANIFIRCLYLIFSITSFVIKFQDHSPEFNMINLRLPTHLTFCRGVLHKIIIRDRRKQNYMLNYSYPRLQGYINIRYYIPI